jgi:hypothetical protein
MKNTILLSIALCSSSLLFAKDKKEDNSPPVLTQDQKIELLTLQRDAAIRAAEAQPYLLRMQQANERYQQKVQERMKDVDQSKWSLDFMTLEFSAVPVRPIPGSALKDAAPIEGKGSANPPTPPK